MDKNLGHNDCIDNDDDDDDGDALADFKRWAYHLKTAAKQDLDISVVFLGCFGALWGVSGMTDGWCTIPGGGLGRTNQGDLTGDRFQVIVPLFTYENGG